MHGISATHVAQLTASVQTLVQAWPAQQPLALLHSAAAHDRWGRWSILSSPESFHTCHADDQPLEKLHELIGQSPTAPASTLPYAGGWIGYLSYELGRIIEPAVCTAVRPAYDRHWPLAELAYCPAALVHDNLHGRWYAVGDADKARALLATALDAQHISEARWTAGDVIAHISPDAHIDAVQRTLAYIAAGDIFQANITQPLTAAFSGSSRALAAHAMSRSGARYGAYLELPDGRCLISMSPELFLEVDAKTRTVTTRPIKGTRPQQVDPQILRDSAKDAAELHMIVDLMRNDLGRVCSFGSVQVEQTRTIESHPTVHHGVSTIRGTLRDDVSCVDLLRATFPGGSITGAPKIRAMQIIEQLETSPRGPYCGAIGMFSSCGNVALNIAIRTMLLQGTRENNWPALTGTLTYGVGGGIVADSDPVAEYRESIDKAAVLRLVLRHDATTRCGEVAPPADLQCTGRSARPRRAGSRD